MRRSVVVFVDDVGGECRVGGLEGREGRKEGRGVPVNWIRMKGGEGKGGEGRGREGGRGRGGGEGRGREGEGRGRGGEGRGEGIDRWVDGLFS